MWLRREAVPGSRFLAGPKCSSQTLGRVPGGVRTRDQGAVGKDKPKWFKSGVSGSSALPTLWPGPRVSINKAQTYPHPQGPGCGEKGDPGVRALRVVFSGLKLVDTLASWRGTQDHTRGGLSWPAVLLSLKGGQTASIHLSAVPALSPPWSGPLQPPLLRCGRAWGPRSRSLARHTYFSCLCAIISVPGRARAERGRRQRPPRPGSLAGSAAAP